jgi:putative Holliday junction resolvase
MSQTKTFLALDVGEKRIGVAVGDSGVRIAVPFDTIEVDGNEIQRIAQLVVSEKADTVVVGYPRNQSGEPTAQTAYVENFAKQLTDIAPDLVFQDESLTSVLAEQRLKGYGRPYSKGDIDAQAAAILLQDYLEQH